MNANNADRNAPPDIQGTMKSPLMKSAAFHGVLLVIIMVGLPIFRPNVEIIPEAVPIEIATVADKSSTDKAPARADVEKPKPEEKKPEEKPKPTPAPTNTAEAPQKPVLEKPKPVEKPKPQESKADDIADPDKKAEEKPKPVEKPKPPEKKPEVQQEQKEAFNSVLKNLMQTEPVAGEKKMEAPQTGETPSPMASLSDKLAVNEITARLSRQLAQCWNVLAGAKYAENQIVSLRITVNPDRTVRDAQVIDTIRYNSDTYFRAAADSALRALKHPYCTPLDLPTDKYDLWKVIDFNFDPSLML
ncbi:MAG TPA: hypothetical protein VGD95_04840 [Micavibrio sp.]